MAMTPAERQAARRDRIQQTIDDLTAANAALVAELAKERDTSQALRAELQAVKAELDALKSRLQAAEMASLRSEVKRLKKAAQNPANAGS